MPLVNFDDPATYELLYRAEVDGRVYHFERPAKQTIFGEDGARLKEALSLEPGQRILIVGGGYGWIAEDWADDGLGPIVVTDTSAHIQATKADHARVSIVNEGCMTPESRAAVAALFDGPIDVVITEDVMPCLSDQEAQELAQALRELSGNVVHWCTCGEGDAEFINWKTAEGWKEFLAPDRLIARGGEVLL